HAVGTDIPVVEIPHDMGGFCGTCSFLRQGERHLTYRFALEILFLDAHMGPPSPSKRNWNEFAQTVCQLFFPQSGNIVSFRKLHFSTVCTIDKIEADILHLCKPLNLRNC